MPPRGWRKRKPSAVEVPSNCPHCGDPDTAHRQGMCMGCGQCQGWIRLGPHNDQGLAAGWYNWTDIHQ